MKVPNIQYTDRNKFAFGAVMQVNGMNYYVSVSSFDKKQEANTLIRMTGDAKLYVPLYICSCVNILTLRSHRFIA